MTFSYDSTMTTNDLNMPRQTTITHFVQQQIKKMFNMCLPATSITLSKRYLN